MVTMIKTLNRTNGVDVDRMTDTVEAIVKQPALAAFTFRAANTWIDGGHNRTTVKDFYGAGQEDTSRAQAFVMDNDEPSVLLGTDRGANPVEVVLHALAGCLTTSLVYHAAAQGVEIDEVESQFEGDLDLQGFLGLSENVRNGYEKIRVTLRVKGNAPDEKIRELIETAKSRSAVFDIVSNPVPIEVEAQVG